MNVMKFKFLVGLVLVGIFCGCSTYKQTNAKFLKKWRAGEYEKAAEGYTKYAGKSKNRDSIIWSLEAGTSLWAAGRYDESNVVFDNAEAMMKEYEDGPAIKIGGETLAMFSNQANLPYRGYSYDKIMLNTYKALNYMNLGDADGARVEFKRALERQNDAQRIYREQAEEHHKYNGKESGQVANTAQNFDKSKMTLSGLGAYEGFLNPYSEFVMGLFYLAYSQDQSDREKSLQSFKRVQGIIGENAYLNKDIQMAEKYVEGGGVPKITYIIFETGTAPQRDQVRIDVPIIVATRKSSVPYVGAAFPKLEINDNFDSHLNVYSGDENWTTVELANMDRVVKAEFDNILPSIITKTVAATVVKAVAAYAINEAARKQVAEQDAPPILYLITLIATTGYQAAVNVADTRTWTTLPKQVQYCRFATPKDGKLQFAGPSGERMEFEVQPDSLNLVIVKSTAQNGELSVMPIKLK